jgi:hypothetical protein
MTSSSSPKHLKYGLAAMLALMLLILVCSPANAKDRAEEAVVPVSGSASAQRRVALVIGNSHYASKPLRNAGHDAADLARELEGLGFQVTLKQDLNHSKLKYAIDRFGKQLKKSSVGLFFYAGHGIQVDGENYLIPLGAQISEPELVEYEAVNAERVLAWMRSAKNALNIMILDACRSNPFPAVFRDGGAGLAAVKQMPRGSIVLFSAAPGEKAADGQGRNSPFTRALLANLRQPGLTAMQALQSVQTSVYLNTGGKQSPWLQNSPLMGKFYFQLAGGPGTVPPGSDPRKKRIDKLLKEAEVFFDSGDLTTPEGSNAKQRFRAVLALDPMNQKARAGLQRIVAQYANWAESRIRAKDYAKAEQYLKRAEQVKEGNERVLALRDELRKAQQQAAFQAEQKRQDLARQKAAEEDARQARLEKERQAKAEAVRKEQARKEADRKLNQASQAVERSSDGRYSKDRDGVINDSRTGLQWYVGPDRTTNWYDAKKWVENLRVAGGGWRMPSRSELGGISQKGARNGGPEYLPAIFKTSGWWVWSGETHGASNAWGFSFDGGEESWDDRGLDFFSMAFAVRSRR